MPESTRASATSTSAGRAAGLRPVHALGVLLLAACAASFIWDVLLARVMTTTLHLNDFGRFYDSARAFLEHADMYEPGPAGQASRAVLGGTPFLNLNPPHFHLLVLPLALMPPEQAVGLWMVMSLFGLVLSLLLIAREIELSPAWPFPLLVATGALGFTGTQAFFATGQVSLILLLAVTLVWVDARHGRWGRAGLVLGVCMSVKPFLLIFLPYLAMERRWRALGAACGAAAGTALVGVLVFGVDNYRSWYHAMRVSSEWAWAAMNASGLGFFARVFAVSPYFHPVAQNPRLVALWMPFAGLVAVATLAVIRVRPSVDLAFALLLLAAQLISPLGWVYYLWLPAGPLAALLRVRQHRRPDATGPGEKAIAVGLVLALLLPTGLTLLGQPHGWATATIGSAYFWATTVLWLACAVAGFGQRPGALVAAAV